MPWTRPTLQDLYDSSKAHLRSHLPGSDPFLRRSNLRAFAEVVAGAAHLMHGFLAYLSRQIMIDTAETAFLDRHAAVWGVARKGAAAASGNVDFTGADGSVIPAGAELQSGDGAGLTTGAAVAIAAGVATAPVTAVELGAAGNLDAGASVSLVSPVGGVDSLAAVAAGGLTGGADVESDDRFRGRLLDRVQQPPQGGAAHDYIAWALEIDGVTRAWVFPSELGLGTVVVRFTTDDDPAGIIPSLAKTDEVLASIDPRRPVTAAVTILPPVAVALDLTIQLTPNTATVQAAVEASLNDLLRREAIPGGTILLSHIREAISVAAGETNHVLVSPVADVTHQTGEIAVLGAVIWT